MIRRVTHMVTVLATLSVVLFYALHLMPGSPEEQWIASNPAITAEDVERLRRLRGLDRPIFERYGCWVWGRTEGRCQWWPGAGLVHGDLGWSRVHKAPVAELIGVRVQNTLRLMIPAFLLALLVSVVLGILAAVNHRRWPDYLVSGVAFTGVALPVHWFGLIAILVMSVQLGWFPSGGVQDPRAPSVLARVHHAVLPVLVLSLFYVGRWTRHVRGALLEVIREDWVRAARARGLDERTVLLRHALRGALIPLVTVVAQSIPSLFSGALVTERVFAYQGMGLLIFESVLADDHVVAMTAFMIFAALTLLATLLADGLYRVLDPRQRDPEASL